MQLAFCSGGLQGRCVPLRRGTTRVGRSPENELTLPRDDVTVSRAHALIERGPTVLTIRDAGSATGTFVNGRQLAREEAAHAGPGDWILFGASGPAALVLDAGDAPPRAWIVVEAAAHPGPFVAAADTATFDVVVDRSGRLLPHGKGRGRQGLTFRLDRTPVQAVSLGADASTDGRAVAPGQVVAVRQGGPELRVLGCQGAVGAVAKAGIGEGTLLKILRRRGRRGGLVMLVLVLVAAGALATAGYYVLKERDRQREAEQAAVQDRLRDTADQIRETEERTAAALAAEKAERERLLASLSTLQLRVSQRVATRQKEIEQALEVQQEQVKQASQRASQSERERFAKLLRDYRDSIFLLFVQPTLRAPNGKKVLIPGGWGTGWIASADGLLVTNKHVVQPWKFDPQVQFVLQQNPGVVVDVEIHAWAGGARFTDARGRVPNARTSHNTRPGGTLRMRGTPPDAWRRVEVEFEGSKRRSRAHDQSNADLAVLQIRGKRFTPLPIKGDPTGLPELHPVMMLGFPLGARILETGHSDLSHSLGTIRWVRTTVAHSAMQFPGNSGGPLISIDGEVVGVTTWTPPITPGQRAQGLSTAIRSDEVLQALRRIR